MSIKSKDHGYKKLMKSLRTASTPREVTVGIHEAEGSSTHEGGKASVAEVGEFHEFGTKNIPRRSFIRDWADENSDKHRAMLRTIGQAIIQGKYSVEVGLARFGARAVGEIQRRMAAGISPPLKESTIKRKGSSVPLIDTGQLRSSIAFKVE